MLIKKSSIRLSYLSIILFMTFLVPKVYAQEMPKEVAFYYYMKLYDHTPEDVIQCEAGLMKESTLLKYYSTAFDRDAYKKNRNDEFAFHSYLKTLRSRILTDIEKIDFNEKFILAANAQLGEYSFDNNSFPVYIREKWTPTLLWEQNLEIQIGEILNVSDISWNLNISPEKAGAFIESRKSKNGNVNRVVYLNVTYSIVNRRSSIEKRRDVCGFGQSSLIAYFYKVDLYANEARTNKLGTILPQTDYYDKANGIKMKDGKDTIFYEARWNPETGQHESSYYVVKTHKDGKMLNLVRAYYANGNIKMIGAYNGCADEVCRNGTSTWFYESGQKAASGVYENGKRHGTYLEYHPSGRKKLKVNYQHGLKHGCEYQWYENGKLQHGTWSTIDYYENGQNKVGYPRSRCSEY